MENEYISITKGERTQAEIVSAAHRLFIDKGFHGTSMRQIAEHAGLAVGGIYNHFSSKEEIFVAVLIEHHPYKQVIPAMEESQGDTIEEFTHSAAAHMVQALESNPGFLNLMFIEIVEFNSRHIPHIFEMIFPQLAGFTARFGQFRGELRAIPPQILLRAFIGLFFSYYITEVMIGQQFSPEFKTDALNYFVDIYLRGILA